MCHVMRLLLIVVMSMEGLLKTSQMGMKGKKMKILIIGGTRFLGKAIAESALSRGHEVTLFNRGQSSPEGDIMTKVKHLRGDRCDDLEKVTADSGEYFDAVVDTCGFAPRVTSISAKALSKHAKAYLFVSSISVNENLMDRTDLVVEDSPVEQLPEHAGDSESREFYGPLKALSEQAVDEHFAGRTIHIRPGLIIGPGDYTDRFNYWILRCLKGGEVLSPIGRDVFMQLIDVRDIAEFAIDAIEKELTGIFNVTGLPNVTTFGEVFDTLVECGRDYRRMFENDSVPTDGAKDAKLVLVPESMLIENKVNSWIEMPLWIEGQPNCLNTCNVAKAVRAGLKLRPLYETVMDTLKWHFQERGAGYQMVAGLDAERETSLLKSFYELQGGNSLGKTDKKAG